MSCNHSNIGKQLKEPIGYIQWFDWADKQIKKGNTQTLCNDCNRFVWVSKPKRIAKGIN